MAILHAGFTHAHSLYTGRGIRARDGRHPVDEDLGIVSDGALIYEMIVDGRNTRPGKILWVGSTDQLPPEYRKGPLVDLAGKNSLMPGLIDSHTHLVFAGDRASEFARRCGGESYQKIAAEGGGILTTVNATRDASLETIVSLGSARAQEAYSRGTRTLEVKSGYGLSLESELKLLRAVTKLRELHPEITFVSTFLGAHDFPKDMDRDEYVRALIEEHLPAVAHEQLAEYCDVFIDEGFYTLDEGRRILTKARALGFRLKVHADELANTESAALAVELGADSADHLLKISAAGISRIAGSSTTATLLPGTAFYLRAPHAPARKLIDAGARVAISTDFNPGTSMTLNLPAVLTIAALYLGMSRAELFAAVTYNAACAVGRQGTKGTLEVGMDADFWLMPFPRFEEVYYRFAW